MAAAFHRLQALVGTEGMARLSAAGVIVFGVGGVGSWCAEALVRNGIGRLTLVDADAVDVTNINRQLPALHTTVGQPKVEVLGARFADISPGARIDVHRCRFNPETAGAFELATYDAVVDAIDSVDDKVLLIETALAAPVPLFSSMGAACRLDASRIRTGMFWKAEGCPLARSVRQKLRQHNVTADFPCVFSSEAATRPDPSVNGSAVHVTGTFGFLLAGLVVQHLLSPSGRSGRF